MSPRRPCALFLAASLGLLGLAGCGGSPEPTVSEAPTQPTDSAQTAREKEDAMKNYDPRKNMTGG